MSTDAQPKTRAKKTSLQLYLPADIHMQLKLKAVKDGVSMKTIVIAAIKRVLKL